MFSTMFVYILVFSILGSVGALIGSGLLLAFPKVHDRLKTQLLAYAVGTLLGGAFLGLLPHALEHLPPPSVMTTTLIGILAFFTIEKILRLPHHHSQCDHHTECDTQTPHGMLILMGDALHNFVDGVVIAAAFLTSVPLGLMTSLAVVAHEIPQELGDFVILLQSGWSKKRAFWLNFLVALATIPGAILAYFTLSTMQEIIPYLLALSAASFLYIATSDLVPLLHHETSPKKSAWQLLFILLGIGTLYAIHQGFHSQ